MKRAISIAIFCLTCQLTYAQAFEWKSRVQPVDTSGFYKIALTPEIVSKLGDELSDIRIYDEASNTEVPYIIQSEVPFQSKQLFKEYQIIEKRVERNKYTYLTLLNENQSKITNIILQIKNADVSKELTLLGSDDRNEWYVIKDKFYISNIDNPTETSELRILNFPLSNYKYYQLKISDRKSAPLNILGAGYYDFISENGKYNELPMARITQKDSLREKKTYIELIYSGNYCIDRMNFTFSGAPFFLRHATLFEKRERKVKKKKTETYLATIASFTINSTDFNSFSFSNLKSDKLLLVIDNGDNPPLTLQKINAFQLNRQLVAWFEKGKSYSIMMGNKKINAPIYDLTYFENKIPAQLKALTLSSVSPTENTTQVFELSWFSQKRIIWIALTAIVILLGIMTLRLVGDMKK